MSILEAPRSTSTGAVEKAGSRLVTEGRESPADGTPVALRFHRRPVRGPPRSDPRRKGADHAGAEPVPQTRPAARLAARRPDGLHAAGDRHRPDPGPGVLA